jgi:hypothetical protein
MAFACDDAPLPFNEFFPAQDIGVPPVPTVPPDPAVTLLSLPQAVSAAMAVAEAVMTIILPKVLQSTLFLSVIACGPKRIPREWPLHRCAVNAR